MLLINHHCMSIIIMSMLYNWCTLISLVFTSLFYCYAFSMRLTPYRFLACLDLTLMGSFLGFTRYLMYYQYVKCYKGNSLVILQLFLSVVVCKELCIFNCNRSMHITSVGQNWVIVFRMTYMDRNTITAPALKTCMLFCFSYF